MKVRNGIIVGVTLQELRSLTPAESKRLDPALKRLRENILNRESIKENNNVKHHSTNPLSIN